jgi:peptidoglycan/LPS O-acetylase OafA/YrhL
MPGSINDPVRATWIFSAILLIAFLISIKRKSELGFFPVSLTQELKGFAILSIIFSHIGYFLVSDHRFLHPLSILAGVGVNLFLFLSGYGLVFAALRKKISTLGFYKRRLIKLFIPFWAALAVFLLLDFLLLKIGYSCNYIFRSFAGFFPSADLVKDINSPFWYFSLIFFYYLIFPILFMKKRPWLSAVFVYAIAYLIVREKFEIFKDVEKLYEVHILAFPLGMIIGWLFYERISFDRILPRNFSAYLSDPDRMILIRNFISLLKSPNFLNHLIKNLKKPLYYALLAVMLIIFAYTAVHSGVGESTDKEQAISLITMSALVIIFIMKKFEVRLLYFFGFYSYEIYLLHWPIMSRYDFLFKYFPAWLAAALYLILFLGLGWTLKKISCTLSDKIYLRSGKS